MKKAYIQPSVSVMMMENQPLMAASPNYDSNVSSDGDGVSGSSATSNQFIFEELGEDF